MCFQGGRSRTGPGTRTAIDTYPKLNNRVPDVVYDPGVAGKEPMIRLPSQRGVSAWLAVEIVRRPDEGYFTTKPDYRIVPWQT